MEPQEVTVKDLRLEVEAKEKELALSDVTRDTLFSEAAKTLVHDERAQKALERKVLIQSRARLRSVVYKFMLMYHKGMVLSFYELYQMLDNESCWLKNRTVAENLREFKSAMLDSIQQVDTLSGEAEDVILESLYRKYTNEFAEGLTPFLEIQEHADLHKLLHVRKAYNGYKAPKLERVK